MKNLFLLLVCCFVTINAFAQIDKSALKSSTLLVEAFEETGTNCKNKPVHIEVGFGIAPVVHFCPNKDMHKRDKKEIEKWNGKLAKRLATQESLWADYSASAKIVSQKDLESETYTDIDQYRYVLQYKYVMTSPGNGNTFMATRYYILDRKIHYHFDFH